MLFVGVILPLQLPKQLTYSVPPSLATRVEVGLRVSVPLGRSKTYTAIVVEKSDMAPTDGIEYRDIIDILDDAPIVNSLQLKLWQWLSEYYICSPGDIYRCAIPSGLKPDTLHEGYRPRTQPWLRLSAAVSGEMGLQQALTQLRRAPMQQKLLTNFIYMSTNDWKTYSSVSRQSLLAAQPGSTNALRALIDKGYLVEEMREVSRLEALDADYEDLSGEPSSSVPLLSEDQQRAYDKIYELWQEQDVVLLHGVTSSGKTEIYSRLIIDTISQGGQVLFLVPEIALTTQLMRRMRRVLGSGLGIYHSGFSGSERVEIYRKQLSAEPYKVIMGARSAMFLPFNNLRLVIVDEEHEQSYRQDSPAPRYHARNSAIMLAHLANAKTLLGSATPAVETYYNAQTGKYGLVTLDKRFGNVQLPDIEIVDIKDCRHRKMYEGSFMDPLTDAIRSNISQSGQTILFQNRRGYSHCLVCADCGSTPRCPNCDVSLTHHRHHGHEYLTCHYCGYSIPVPVRCPSCGSTRLSTSGIGTERIVDEAAKLFPGQRIARLDTDTTQRKNAHKQIVEQFADHSYDILVGTQMVSKGLDFKDVSLVAVLNADSLLTLPDFRATERAYQLLEQVSGRAGRRETQGKVIIQTYDPAQPVMQWVMRHDYRAFYDAAVAERSLLRYPPFVRMYQVVMRHANRQLLENAAQYARTLLASQLGDSVSDVIDPIVPKIQNLCYKNIIIRLPLNAGLKAVRASIISSLTQMTAQIQFHAVNYYVVVDP